MMMRKLEYFDVYLTQKELVKLKKGWTVHRRWNGKGVAIKCESQKTNREIARLKAKIRALERRNRKPEVTHVA